MTSVECRPRVRQSQLQLESLESLIRAHSSALHDESDVSICQRGLSADFPEIQLSTLKQLATHTITGISTLVYVRSVGQSVGRSVVQTTNNLHTFQSLQPIALVESE